MRAPEDTNFRSSRSGRLLISTYQIGYGGLLKLIKKQLKLDDADNGDLINTDGEQLLEPTESKLIVAKWDSQRENYLIW